MNTSDFNTAKSLREIHNKNKATKEKQQFKDRLQKITEKKMQTIMIGSLSSFEKSFGFLWTVLPEDTEEIIAQKMDMKELYDEAREEILNLGNNQIRNFRSELEQYEIVWKRYQLNIPFKPVQEG